MAVTRFQTDNREIRARFKTLFQDVYPTIRVVWENQPEDAAGAGPFPSIEGEFVRILLRQTNSRQVSTGGSNRRFRHSGTVQILVHTEAGKGTNRNEEIADAAARVFASTTVGGIVFRSATYFQQGFIDRYFRGTVAIPYSSSFLE